MVYCRYAKFNVESDGAMIASSEGAIAAATPLSPPKQNDNVTPSLEEGEQYA